MSVWRTEHGTAGWHRQLMIAAITIAVGHGVRPIVSYRALELGATPFELGLVVAAYALLAALAAMPVGSLVDRWGERSFIVAGCLGLSAAAVGLLFAPSLVTLGVAHAAFGLAMSFILVATQTMLANRTSGVDRSSRFGTYFVVVSLGQFIGPAVAGVLASMGSPDGLGGSGMPVFVASLVTALVAAALGLGLPDRAHAPLAGDASPPRGAPLVASTRIILRLPSMREAMVSSITILASIDLLGAYLPVFAAAQGLQIEVVGALLAVRAIFSMVSRLFMARVLERFGRRLVLAVGLLGAALGMLLLPLSGGLLVLLFAAMALIGLGLGLGQPITISWVSAIAPRSLRGTALGVRISGNRVTQLVAPLVAGGIASAAGVASIYPTLALLLLVSAGAVFRGREEGELDTEIAE